jgi:hypothetical protein
MYLYLDGQCMAHARQDEQSARTPWEDRSGVFAGKCDAFIEGFRIVPEGQTWTREDGAAFSGLMIAPAADPKELLAAQTEADGETIAALDAMVVELTYQYVLLEYGA